MRTYHLGVYDGYDGPDGPYSRTGTLHLEAKTCVDDLSCETLEYFGERETTKARLRRERGALLAFFNERLGTSYSKLVVH